MYGAGIKRRLGLTGFSLDSQERLLVVVIFEPKTKRVGRYAGKTNRVKKAIVKLKEGSSIELN